MLLVDKYIICLQQCLVLDRAALLRDLEGCGRVVRLLFGEEVRLERQIFLVALVLVLLRRLVPQLEVLVSVVKVTVNVVLLFAR